MLENNKNAVTVIYSGGDIQVPFIFFDEDDLVVLYELTPKVLGTDYTVTGAGNEAGGMVLLTVPPANGTRVTVIRKVEFTQLLQIPPNGIIPEGAMNRVLDRIVMMIQQLAEQAERAVTYPEGTDKGQVANAGEMLDSIEKARTDINNAVSVAGTTLNTANEKLGEINTVSSTTLQQIAEQQQRNEETVSKAEDAAARAQSLPLGHVIHGFWKAAPAGTLALRMAKWPIASFPDLYQMAVDAGIAVPKVTYDAIKSAKGSVGFFGIDVDGVSFWTPHLEDIAVSPASPDVTGFETGDINLASLPDIFAKFITTYSTAEGAVSSGETVQAGFTGGSSGYMYMKTLQASGYNNTYGRDGDSEVRTKRMHLLFCVVAYHDVRPVAVAEMAAMLASITQLQEDVNALQSKALGVDQMLIAEDRKPLGVAGGASLVYTWATRDLNTLAYNSIEGASLAQSKVRVPAGKYIARWETPFYVVGKMTSRLENRTDSVTLVQGSYGLAREYHPHIVSSTGYGLFEVSKPTDVAIQYQSELAYERGLGIESFTAPLGYGRFTQLVLYKVG